MKVDVYVHGGCLRPGKYDLHSTDLASIQIISAENVRTLGRMAGWAAAGAILAGPLGLVVGGLVARKQNQVTFAAQFHDGGQIVATATAGGYGRLLNGVSGGPSQQRRHSAPSFADEAVGGFLDAIQPPARDEPLQDFLQTAEEGDGSALDFLNQERVLSCPSCRSPVTITAADVGFDVQCPNCRAWIQAKL